MPGGQRIITDGRRTDLESIRCYGVGMPELFYFSLGSNSLITHERKFYLSAKRDDRAFGVEPGSYELTVGDDVWKKLIAFFDQHEVWAWEATYDDWEIGYCGDLWQLIASTDNRAVFSKPEQGAHCRPPSWYETTTAISALVAGASLDKLSGSSAQIPITAEKALLLAIKGRRGVNWRFYNESATIEERLDTRMVEEYIYLLGEAEKLQEKANAAIPPERLQQRKLTEREPYKPLTKFSPFQSWDKPTCCSKNMKFVREWFQEDFTRNSPDGDGFAFYKQIADGQSDMWEYIGNSVVVAFVFKCTKCSKFEALVDYS